MSNRPSLIKNPILQLQKDKPLTAETISLLSLGPKFAVTPKEIPKMEIVAATENNWQRLERKGEKDKAQVLRHEVVEILKGPETQTQPHRPLETPPHWTPEE